MEQNLMMLEDAWQGFWMRVFQMSAAESRH